MALGSMGLGMPSRGVLQLRWAERARLGQVLPFAPTHAFPVTPGSLLAAASYYFGLRKIDQFWCLWGATHEGSGRKNVVNKC